MMESWNHAALVTEADKRYTEKIGEIMKQLPEIQQAYIEGLAVSPKASAGHSSS